MSTLASQLINENKRSKATTLNLKNCEITELPKDLATCFWLKELILYGNKELDDLSLVANLHNLQSLDCSYTQVTDLSPITNLRQLKRLDCSDTEVCSLNPLVNFRYLQYLDCSSTQINDLSPIANLRYVQYLDCSATNVSDIKPIANLCYLQQFNSSSTSIKDLSPVANVYSLKRLSCSSTQVSDLSPVENLHNLQIFYCYDTKINDLNSLTKLLNLHQLYCQYTIISNLSPIANLNHLQRLNCSNTHISDLKPLTNLYHLQRLNCSNTSIRDLNPLINLIKLQQVDCSDTQISDLTPLTNLKELKQLFCFNTLVSDLSPLLSLMKKGMPVKWQDLREERKNGKNEGLQSFFKNKIFLVKNCPLITPPIDFVQNNPEAVVEYFKELGKNRNRLNEVKIIFLGEGAAGKTSLIKRLLGENFDINENQTHGIRIRKVPFEVDSEKIVANVWDFGGQEVMHATHQFFLSQRCIYVLVLNSRSEDRAEYWLKHASSFGGNSPILVVLNKIDENPSFEVNRKLLQEKYPQIKSFHRLSCMNDKGVQEFETALRSEVTASTARRTPFPATWTKVKEYFANMKADYIQSTEYQKVCVKNGVKREFSQDVLLQFLHDLGIIVNFRNLKHFDTQILNPKWLTKGVYRIINSDFLESKKGMLEEKDLDIIINAPRYTFVNGEQKYRYPTDKLLYIVRVMEEFELCYEVAPKSYVVPQLLDVSEPDFSINGAVIHFTLRFPDFLPDSIFPRFIVKMHSYIKDQLRWRTGIILHKPEVFDATARIRVDKEDKLIQIAVCGENRRRLLTYIRRTFKEIIQSFTNLTYEEMVPIPNTNEFLEYEYLVEAKEAKEDEVFVRTLKKRIKIADLLDGVEEALMRDAIEQTPVKVFVSYSHKDVKHLKALRAALSPLERLRKLSIWDDREIDAGEEWEKEIFRQLDEADIILFLLSSDFIKCDFHWRKELIPSLNAYNAGKKMIIPIKLRECDLENTAISAIQCVPRESWICSAPSNEQDSLWLEVSKSLNPVIDKIKKRKADKSKER